MYEPQLKWSIDNNLKIVLITFNKHNKKLIPVLEREQKKAGHFNRLKNMIR